MEHVINRRDFWGKFGLVPGNKGDNDKKSDEGKIGIEKPRETPDGDVTKSASEASHKDEGKEETPPYFHTIDIYRHTHPTTRRFTYYPRSRPWGTSCDRVDYVLASKKLWDTGCVTECGIMDNEVDRGPSDHVPVWVDVVIGKKGEE
jgi:exonuclease III